MRILVVDDDEYVARAVQRRLIDHAVVIETDPARVVGLVEGADREGTPFDLAICDATLPGKSGFDIATTLRSRVEPPIVILMSGYDDIVNAASCADAAILKPFSTSEILETIARVKAQRSRVTTRRLRRFAAPDRSVDPRR